MVRRKRNDTFLDLKLGDYRLEDIIAIGGMARVYLANDEKLQRQAAVKVLDLNQDWVDETIVQRFEREALSVAGLEHPNIITIYAYGTEHDAYYQAMQYVEGEDLRLRLAALREAGKLMPTDQILTIAEQVASALDYAHQHGIIHRDIKPSNVLLRPDNTAVLTDFGLVLRNDDNTMGTAFGTPRYIAPEQAVASEQAVAQSDVYSFAVILYEMLTGDTPFDGESPMEIALSHVSEKPDPPSHRNPNLPPAVDTAMMIALSKEPNERQASATELVQAIATALAEDETDPVGGTAPVNAPAQAPAQPAPAASAVGSAPAASSGKRWGMLTALVAVVVVLGGAGLFFGLPGLGAPGAPSLDNLDIPGASMVPGETIPVALTYTSEIFVMQNVGESPLAYTRQVQFQQGREASAVITGFGTLPPGHCFYIQNPGTPRDLLAGCDEANEIARTFVPEDRYWRADEGTTFTVTLAGELLATCETVAMGRQGACDFDYPVFEDES